MYSLTFSDLVMASQGRVGHFWLHEWGRSHMLLALLLASRLTHSFVRCSFFFFFFFPDDWEYGEDKWSKRRSFSKRDVHLMNTSPDQWVTVPVTAVSLWPAGIWPQSKSNLSNEQAVSVSLQQLALSSPPVGCVYVSMCVNGSGWRRTAVALEKNSGTHTQAQ